MYVARGILGFQNLGNIRGKAEFSKEKVPARKTKARRTEMLKRKQHLQEEGTKIQENK